jgi:hypothetical protein
MTTSLAPTSHGAVRVVLMIAGSETATAPPWPLTFAEVRRKVPERA